MSKTSPFLLKADDVDTLAHSDGFQILRLHLRDHYSYEYVDAGSTSTAQIISDEVLDFVIATSLLILKNSSDGS